MADKVEYITTKEVAELLGVTPSRVGQLLKEGRMPYAEKTGEGSGVRYKFTYDNVEAYQKAQEASKRVSPKKKPETHSDYLSTKEVAEFIGVTPSRVLQLVNEGRMLFSAKIGEGKRYRLKFTYDDVDRFIKSKDTGGSYHWDDIWKEFTDQEQDDIMLAINLLDKAVPNRTPEQKAFLKRAFSSSIDLCYAASREKIA